MRLISLDIDPKNRSNRIHLGPFVSGLNAVWGERGAGKSTIAKFLRGLLYNRHRDVSGYGQEAVDGLVGSLQWADEEGITRIISTADATHGRDYRFSGPYYYGSEQASHSNAAYPHSVPLDQPWHRLSGEVFDAVFCGRLGETLPERLWQAARELGIHVSLNKDQDEVYRRLKSEEWRLQQRLHHIRVDDRDRDWWGRERERLAKRIEEITLNPDLHTLPINKPSIGTQSNGSYSLDPAKQNQVRLWESELVQLRSEQSELTTRDAELSRQIVLATNELRAGKAEPSGRHARSTTIYRDPYGSWTGYVQNDRARSARVDRSSNSPTEQEVEFHGESMVHEHARVRSRLAEVTSRIEELLSFLKTNRYSTCQHATTAWELEELRSRLAYAEEVLRSWELYEQTRARLAEIQEQLRGKGPYAEAVRGSFMQTIERYLRELSAGAIRRLPTWALEALRRDIGFASGLANHGRVESYREVYRDYRPDLSKTDAIVPASHSSERQLVELSIRMAIIDAAANRIGRLPLVLDDALDGFHGQSLDHLVRVLIEFAREGQQVLLLTSEEEVAARVRVHHGWVADLNQTLVAPQHETRTRSTEVPGFSKTYVAPSPVSIPLPAASLAPAFAPSAYQGPQYDPAYSISADHFAGVAPVIDEPFLASKEPVVEQPTIYRYEEYPKTEGEVLPRTRSLRFFLNEASPIENAPGMHGPMGQRAQSIGLHTVGQWIVADPRWVATRIGLPEATIENILLRQAEARLMCGVPQLRAFDARILAGCGITTPQTLAQLHPGRLLTTVERFLRTPYGQEIMQSGTSYELSRITGWIASARNSLHRSSPAQAANGLYRTYSDRTGTSNRGSALSSSSSSSSSSSNSSSSNSSRSSSSSSGRSRSRLSNRSRRTRSSRMSTRPSDRESGSTTRTERRVRTLRSDRPERVRHRVERTARPEGTQRTASASAQTATVTTRRRLRFYLSMDSSVVHVPGIGPRTTEKLNALGIHTVADFLAIDPVKLESQLNDRRINTDVIVNWKKQAILVCRTPNLRGHDAQMIVACGISTPEELAVSDKRKLYQAALAYSETTEGQRTLRGAKPEGLEEVENWIDWANHSRSLKAA